jgi:hypothetical protein
VDFASISEVTGLVQVISADGSAVPIEERMNLRVGGTFHLKSANGKARLTLVDGSSICIPPNSEIEFLKASSGTGDAFDMHLNLIAGGMLFIDPENQNSTFQIEQPLPIAIGSQGAIIGIGKNAPERAALNLDCLSGICSFESEAGRVELQNPGSTWLSPDGIFSSVALPQVSRWANLCTNVTGKRVAGVPTPTRDTNIFNFINGLVAPGEISSPTPRPFYATQTQALQPVSKTATPVPSTKTRVALPTATKSPSPTATVSPTTWMKPSATLQPPTPVFPTQTDTPLPPTQTPTTPESLIQPSFTPTPPILASPTLEPTLAPTLAPTDIPAPTPLPTQPPTPVPQPTEPAVLPTQAPVLPTETPAA